MSEDKPNFALLIGKRLADKGKPDAADHEKDLMPDGDGAEQEDMENSAVADFMAALASKNVPAAKAALKDFLDLCSGSEPDGDEEEAPPEV